MLSDILLRLMKPHRSEMNSGQRLIAMRRPANGERLIPVKVCPHVLHLYRTKPSPSLPHLMMSPEPHFGHVPTGISFTRRASPAALTDWCVYSYRSPFSMETIDS